MKPSKWIMLIVLAAALIFGTFFIRKLNGMARIGVAYKVKMTCSEVFVAGRNFESVLTEDFGGIDPLLQKIKIKLDAEAKSLTGSLWGLGKSKAAYREGVGCSVAVNRVLPSIDIPQPVEGTPYQIEIDPAVQSAILALFENMPSRPIKTRSAVVIQNGKIVGEHYARGFDKDTPQISWSMAKSVVAMLLAIAEGEGVISRSDKALFPIWEKDDRAEISLHDMLQMSSGLAFSEDYAGMDSDANQMLWTRQDAVGFASSKPLLHSPGSHWSYSSGTTNMISGVLRDRLGEDYHSFPRRKLYDPIGATSVTMETDASGTFIGSSFIYATARDYARLGQLILQDGGWGNSPVLPQGWAQYVTTPAPASNGEYGAHFWLNPDSRVIPGFPEDVYYFSGHEGQYIFVIPSKNAVIVRLGMTRPPATFEDDIAPLLARIYTTL